MMMTPGDPLPSPETTNSAAAPNSAPPAGEAVGPKYRAGERSRLWLGAVLTAVVAAVGAWLLGESGLMSVAPVKVAVPTAGVIIMAPTTATTRAANVQTAARQFGAFGALLGLLLGLMGGWSRGGARPAVVAAFVGLFAGGMTGAVAPLIVVRAYFRWFGDGTDELIPSMLLHTGLWTAFGAAAGLALAIGSGDRRQLAWAALGGATGAVLGAVLYDLLGAVVFPLDQTGEPLAATRRARLLEFLLPGAAIGAVAALGARLARTGQQSASAPLKKRGRDSFHME
jgi:hypothetical protein